MSVLLGVGWNRGVGTDCTTRDAELDLASALTVAMYLASTSATNDAYASLSDTVSAAPS